MVITQIGRKKLGGHHACLGDIVRNISKMVDFLLIFCGEPGASFTKVGLNRNKFKSFQLILSIVNLTV